MQLRLIYSKISDRVFPRDLPLYNFIKYISNNFVDDLENQKSIIRHYFFLNRAVIL